MTAITPAADRTAPGVDMLVIGAGIVGVACALRLARQGLRVQLVDAQAPGHGASYGNAGHLATEQVFPIADASLLRRLPGMLMDPLGPLRLDWRYLPRALPWLSRLLWNLRPEPFRQTVAGLRALNERSLGAWQRLLGEIGQLALLRLEGSLLMQEHPGSVPGIDGLENRLGEQGVKVERWTATQVLQTVPALAPAITGGLFFPDTGHVLDPLRVVNELARAAQALGVRIVRGRVSHAGVHPAGVTVKTDQGALSARRVLIACGAHSAPLVAALTGRRVPLDTERGYHLMLPAEQNRLPFAVTSYERKFIMTPMNGGLRLAGTVEFAGLKRPPDMRRAWQLQSLSQGLFRAPLNFEGAEPWMGLRPSLPDSLPVIDQAADGKVLLAFGHQHLGLTQAAVTAELIGELAGSGRRPAVLEPYRLDRW